MYGADDWDPALAFLAEVDAAVVGLVVGLSFEGDGNVAILGVVPAWRGRGIAKALLRRAFAELAQRGHRDVRLGVDAQNPTGAVALYESVGMTPYRAYDIYDLGTRGGDGGSVRPRPLSPGTGGKVDRCRDAARRPGDRTVPGAGQLTPIPAGVGQMLPGS